MTELDRRFPDVLRRISIDPGQVPHVEWLAGVNAVGKELQLGGVVGLLRLACRLQSPATDRLIADFRKQDPGFPGENAGELHSILACAVLEAALKHEDEVAQAIALGLEVAAFSNWKPALSELPAIARSNLQRLSVAIRTSPETASTNDAAKVAALEQATTAAQQIGGVGPQISAGFDATKGFVESFNEVAEKLPEMELRIKTLTEELEVLWWLTSGALRDGTPTSSIQPLQLAGELAIDLADMTRFTLPAPSAKALLRRANGTRRGRAQDASIVALVNTLPRERQERCATDAKLGGDLTPIVSAAAHSIQVADSETWIPLAVSSLGGLLQEPRGLDTLCDQLYLELLLTRLLQEN